MRMMILAALCTALLTTPAMAQETATNMAAPYPGPPCTKPDKNSLPKSPGVGDQAAMTSYNLRVRAFNEKAQAFNACMKVYTDAANADIRRIQEVVRAAVAEANAP